MVLESAVTGGIGLVLFTTAWMLTPEESNYPGRLPIVLASFGLISSGYSALRTMWYVVAVVSRGSRSKAAAKKGVHSSTVPLPAPVASSMAAHDIVVGGRFVRFVALLFPRGHHRKSWVKDVAATTATAYEPRRRVRLVRIIAHAAFYPVNVIRAWVEIAGVTRPTVFGLRMDSRKFVRAIGEGALKGLVRLRAFASRIWREWYMAIVFAVLSALLMEPVMYMLTYLLHHNGYELLWEKYFPLD
ncbi:hypothetical protein ACFU96_10235 [Streptomyces sp. NPDC057620]|uniref:hypothetical protein n=1 Tax=Streptomyces sp. NPDC057620 TaxID=3346185 RepID=UPI0036A060B3